MAKRYFSVGFPPTVLSVLVGCGGVVDPGADEDFGVAESAVSLPNALTPNALTPNALTPNALTPNALTPNALTPGALASILQAGDAGALSRELLRYVVGCAFLPSQTFDFSWTDANGQTHDEIYRGELGLTPTWAYLPLLDIGDQRWISACLASRTNWYGVSVMISIRGSHPALEEPSAAELDAYPVLEGAFWGNLFALEPRLFACYTASTVAYARGSLRDCAAGHVVTDPISGMSSVTQCGPIQIAGDCSTLCDPIDADHPYHFKCRTDPAASPNKTTPHVVTTFLP